MRAEQFIILKYEAGYEVDSHVAEAIRDTLEQLRGQGAGRAVSYAIVSRDDYYAWYNAPNRLHEIEIPVPQIITID